MSHRDKTQFEPFQELDACAPHDVEFGNVNGVLHMVFAEDRIGKNSTITSQVPARAAASGLGHPKGPRWPAGFRHFGLRLPILCG